MSCSWSTHPPRRSASTRTTPPRQTTPPAGRRRAPAWTVDPPPGKDKEKPVRSSRPCSTFPYNIILFLPSKKESRRILNYTLGMLKQIKKDAYFLDRLLDQRHRWESCTKQIRSKSKYVIFN